jgi:hypothetical protein
LREDEKQKAGKEWTQIQQKFLWEDRKGCYKITDSGGIING